MAQHLEQPPVFACNLTVLTPAEREEHIANSQALFAAVLAGCELPDGYALRLPAESTTLFQVAKFITYERLCCSFFAFGVEVEPYGGPIWLRLTGGDGVKAFVAAEIGSYLDDAVATAAGL
jgi:hypothetical protein